MTNWHDTPPTKAGYYWVKSRRSGQEWIAERTRHGVWDRITGEVAVAAEDGEAAELVQFGNRIPTADELAEMQSLAPTINRLCELAYWEGDISEAEAKNIAARIKEILGVADESRAD